MSKLEIAFGSLTIGIALWGCNNVSNQIPPPMTEVSLQICGERLVRNKLEKACLSHTEIYWGKLSQKDIKMVEMSPKKRKELEYYFVIVSAAGCVADWAAPIPQGTEIVAIKSMYSEKISGKSPQIKILNLVEVDEEKRKLLVKETEEKLALATLMGSQTTYTQPTCQNFKKMHEKLKSRGYQEIIY